MTAISPALAAAIDAARQAEDIIMHYYGRDIPTRHKADSTPVTPADTEAERVILETLRQRFPGHGFLGEESGEDRVKNELIWVVDPIDGTANYLRGIPLFGTQIALLKEGVPVLGVSNLPAMKELMVAEAGAGAYLNGEPIRTSALDALPSAFISLGGLNHLAATARFEQLLQIVRTAGRVRGFGDAYAFHLVARGRCEAVIDANLHIWDVAALSVIIEEAGGTFTDWQGRRIGLDTTAVVCSNGALHAQLIDRLRLPD